MVAYAPDETLAHRLDPRSKLLVQIAFAAAAFAHTTPHGLAILTVLAVGCVRAAGGSTARILWAYRFAAPILVLGPVVAGATVGAPWFRVERAWETALASYRVVLVLLVAGAYVRSTPVRDSRAAIQRAVPGKPGQFLGIGVALVFRFLPVLRRDLTIVREASRARLGTERSLTARIRLVTVGGLDRALRRADRLGLALSARCFAWNPTLPELRFRRSDWIAVAVGVALLGGAVLGPI